MITLTTQSNVAVGYFYTVYGSDMLNFNTAVPHEI